MLPLQRRAARKLTKIRGKFVRFPRFKRSSGNDQIELNMKKLMFVLITLGIAPVFDGLPQAASANGLSQLDQQQLHYEGGIEYDSERVVWQSFTAGISGILTRIDIGFVNQSSGSARLRLLSGEGLGGQTVQSLLVPVSSQGKPEVSWNAWNVNVPVQAGSRYTFAVAGDAAILPGPDGAAFAIGVDDRYPGGISSEGSDVDLVFRTFVSEIPLGQSLAPGRVVGWGSNARGQIPAPAGLSGVVAVTGGYWHSLALTKDGAVIGWGNNELDQSTVPPGLTGVVAIASGLFHNLALQSDGTVVSWGLSSTVPSGLSNVTAIAACGGYFLWGNLGEERHHIYESQAGYNLALRADGTVVGWGSPSYGEVPAGLTNVVAIATGGCMSCFESHGRTNGHSLALKADGTVVGWGSDEHGESTPPEGLSNVIAIATGGFHSLALKSNGTVVAWGLNGSGQTDVPWDLTNVVAIAAGSFHCLALKADGTVVSWGYDSEGQVSVPGGLSRVVTIAAGEYHSLAVWADAPALALQAGGENISLSWPLWGNGFGLQSTTNLMDQNSWAPLLVEPTTKGSFKQAIDTISGPPRFYRLRK
jgi:hypothetical protein